MAALDSTITNLVDGGGTIVGGDKIAKDAAVGDVTARATLDEVRALFMPIDLTADMAEPVEPTASPTFTGTATMPDTDFGGNVVSGYVQKVVATVTGTLNAADHGGNVLQLTGNVVVPTTPVGFTAVLIAGGSQTVTFNAGTPVAMAAGDVMTVIVESATICKAVLTPAADLVDFS